MLPSDLHNVKKILLLGSGGLSIGQAGEFDYSGTQALKAFLEEGIEVILINPNIATIQTDPIPGTKIYLYPITAHWVEKIIKKEKPHAIVGGFGGQTALNCLIELSDSGVLDKYGVKNLGTKVETLKTTEDRKLFAEKMHELGIPTPRSFACHTLEEAAIAAKEIGFPVMIRCAYALGGLGSGFANNEKELNEIVRSGLANTPQVLVEKYLLGWKEIEYEVMRDSVGNAITICNMENFDPLGVHTGDSIVVTPSQSLTDYEYQLLRNTSLKMINALEIIGECNAQFALCPETSNYYVIEVNARLSRSSALASKASGYPIAYIAAKVVLGYDLLELKNPVTKITSAFYEPALDYITIKMPRWDLEKFSQVDRKLGSTMKSVGEVMAIGRSFPEAIQKAYRMVCEDSLGLSKSFKENYEETESSYLPHDDRLSILYQAMRQKKEPKDLNLATGVDQWFLTELQSIITVEKEIAALLQEPFSDISSIKEKLENIPKETWQHWKSTGFSDEQIAHILLKSSGTHHDEKDFSLQIRKIRTQKGVIPHVKKIDTTASEYPSHSNYLYFSYATKFHDLLPFVEKNSGVIVLGGGAYRIGASVEFDWCSVNSCQRIKESGLRSIMINCNPETVSTDYNTSDRLYFEELNLERILDIAEYEKTKKIIVSMGGQLPNKLSRSLYENGFEILGHSYETIDSSENRKKFSDTLDKLGIEQPKWTAVKSKEELKQFITKIGFPVLIRPSYVLSGAAMRVAYNQESLDRFLENATKISPDAPVVVSQFITEAREIEVDGLAYKGEIVLSIASEHIENAGIHSGDATTVVPPQKLYVETVRQVKNDAKLIAKELKLHGPFNIQFLAKNNLVKVIECNARAARSFPFISKVVGTNFAKHATDIMLGKKPDIHFKPEDELNHVGVKAAMFSFSRLKGSDPVTGVEMSSTGEVGCLGKNFDKAFLLSMESSRLTLPKKGVLLSAGPYKEKIKILEFLPVFLKLGLPIYATQGTSNFLTEFNIQHTPLAWPGESDYDVIKAIQDGRVDLVINIPKNQKSQELTRGYEIRKTSVEHSASLLTNAEKTIAYLKALHIHEEFYKNHKPTPLAEYLER